MDLTNVIILLVFGINCLPAGSSATGKAWKIPQLVIARQAKAATVLVAANISTILTTATGGLIYYNVTIVLYISIISTRLSPSSSSVGCVTVAYGWLIYIILLLYDIFVLIGLCVAWIQQEQWYAFVGDGVETQVHILIWSRKCNDIRQMMAIL